MADSDVKFLVKNITTLRLQFKFYYHAGVVDSDLEHGFIKCLARNVTMLKLLFNFYHYVEV